MSTCAHCKTSGATSYCSRCKSSYYCNVECQRADWKMHKKKCRKLSTAKQENKNKSLIKIKVAHNKDSTFINNLKDVDIINIFKNKICKSSLSAYNRVQALNSLFWPKIIEKFPLYEKCGLYEYFKQILHESYNNLKQCKNDNNSLQMLTLDFLSGIIMIKNSDGNGHDDIDEIYSYKLLKYTDFINIYFEMITLKYCHLEWIRCLFRHLTLILNSKICSKYIIENLMISKTLRNLIPICKETINPSNYSGYTEIAFNAAQGLALQIFYQIEIHATNLKIRNDVLSYLKQNENKLFRMYAYPMAVKQIKEHRCLSIDEALQNISS